MTIYNVTDELTYNSDTHECSFRGLTTTCPQFVGAMNAVVSSYDREPWAEYLVSAAGPDSDLNYSEDTPDAFEFSVLDPEDSSLRVNTYITREEAHEFLAAVK